MLNVNLELARNLLSDDRYSTLPNYKKNNPTKKFFKELAVVAKDLTVILPVAQLILALSIAPLYRFSLKSNIKPHMIKPLSKKELEIREIAKKMGIRDWNRFKVLIGKSFSSEAALHRSTIILPPNDLIRPKDLPASLKLERLKSGEITETEWIVNFVKWLNETYCGKKKKIYTSQFSVDRAIVLGSAMLKSFCNPENRQNEFEATIGHELGHSELKHSFKYISLAFALQLLAWPTFGLYKLFYDKVLEKLSRYNERQADFYCLKKLGRQKELSAALQRYIDCQKFLHPLYPKFFNAQGDSLGDKGHPPLSERIKYLNI